MEYVLIIVVKSDVAKELARFYVSNSSCFYLVARKSDEFILFKEDAGNSTWIFNY